MVSKRITTRRGFLYYSGLIRSQDSGTSWEPLIGGAAAPKNTRALQFVDDQQGWAIDGDASSIHYTANAGKSWVKQYQYPDTDNSLFFNLFFLDAKNGWVVGHSGRIFHTSNGGTNWAQQSSGLPETYSSNLFGIHFINTLEGWASGESCNLLHTTDGGQNWTKISINGCSSGNLRRVVFFDQQHGLVATENGSLLVTEDGGQNWSSPADMTETGVDIAVIGAGEAYVITKNGKLWSASEYGKKWTLLGEPISSPTALSFSDAQNGVVISEQQGAVITPNGGKNWVPIPGIVLPSDVYLASPSNLWLASWNKQILHSEDGGETWKVRVDDYPKASLAAAGTALWAGNSQQMIRSTDGGAEWQLLPANFPVVYFLDETTGWGMRRSPDTTNQVEIAHSVDGGKTWNAKHQFIWEENPSDGIARFAFLSATKGVFSLTSYQGKGVLLRTTDGENWADITSAFTAALNPATGFRAPRHPAWANDSQLCVLAHYLPASEIFCSRDKGDSWSAQRLPMPFQWNLLDLTFPSFTQGWAVVDDYSNSQTTLMRYIPD